MNVGWCGGLTSREKPGFKTLVLLFSAEDYGWCGGWCGMLGLDLNVTLYITLFIMHIHN